MKKLLALILALTMTVSLAACTNDGDADAGDDAQTSSQPGDDADAGDDAVDAGDDAADDNADAEGDDAADAGMTMEDFVSEVMEQLEPDLADLEAQGTPVEVIARDDSLVYMYTYTFDIGDVAAAKTALDEGIAANAATYELIYDELLAAVPSAVSVIVEYYAMDNSLITSGEFK